MCDLSDEGQLGTQRLRDQALHRRTEADARAPQFWTAFLETRHFSFEAYGLTEESCRDALRRALAAHAKKYIRLEADSPNHKAWIDSMMDDANVQPRHMGEGYRDHTCLTGGR